MQHEADPAALRLRCLTVDEDATAALALVAAAEQAGESFDPGLSKAAASQRIDELQKKTGRGRG